MASFKGVANNEISEELKESAKLLCEVFISNEMTVLPCDLKYSLTKLPNLPEEPRTVIFISALNQDFSTYLISCQYFRGNR